MRLAWSRAARADLLAIADYIELDNPPAARAVLERIDRQVARLVDHPELGRRGRVAGTRELVIVPYPYIVVYRLAGEAVQVLRVLHQRRQWPPGDSNQA